MGILLNLAQQARQTVEPAPGAATADSAKPETATPTTPRDGNGRTVATVAVANPQKSRVERLGKVGTGPLSDQAMEVRRKRVVALLTGNPALRLAVVCDAEGDPVPVAIAIRGKGTCEVHIPASRFDSFKLLELVERHSGTLH